MSSIIQVTCGIVIWNNQVLCVQRSLEMHLPLKWEFPGGKIEPGEDEKDCLARELKEELDISIAITEALTPVNFQYQDKPPIRLIPYIVSCKEPNINLKEHSAMVWLEPDSLLQLDWAQADIPIVEEFMNWWQHHTQQN